MEDAHPLTELLKTLETSLTTLLFKVNNDPWSLLMFQTLLWSFRRWAIHYLTSDETSGPMHEYVWDTHIHLVRQFAPDGLKEFGVVWLSPANVGDRGDIIEELNAYFMFIVDALDKALQDDNEDDQNSLSVFLDETITDVLDKWLAGRPQYRIYPRPEDSVDSFPSERIFTIMRLILEHHVNNTVPIVMPTKPVPRAAAVVPVPEPPAPEPPAPEPAPQPAAEQLEQPEPAPEQPAPAPAPEPVKSIEAAIRRRRTMRIHGKRVERGTNAKTRKQSSHSFRGTSSNAH